jgi:hypothetical protein
MVYSILRSWNCDNFDGDKIIIELLEIEKINQSHNWPQKFLQKNFFSKIQNGGKA